MDVLLPAIKSSLEEDRIDSSPLPSIEEETPRPQNDNDINTSASSAHRVTFSVTVVVGFPKPNDDQSRLMEELVRRNKRRVDAPRPTNYLHCEYKISPKHERTVTDVVAYTVAAKVFNENDSRVVKTWDDGDQVWVAWVHSHQIEVTEENVMALYNHVIELKLWDSKEKVSLKARSDRPKAFRLPSASDIAFPGRGVYGIVSKLSNSWTNSQPRDSVSDLTIEKPDLKESKSMIDDVEAERVVEKKDEEVIKTNEKEVEMRALLRVRSSLGRLAGINPTEREKRKIAELKLQQARLQKDLTRYRISSSVPSTRRSASRSKNTPSSARNKSVILKKSEAPPPKSVNIELKLEKFFAGLKTITSRLKEPNGSIRDALISISIDGNLLPEDLERSFNPMVITLKSAKDLPSTPTSYENLATLCKPIYCKYSFLHYPVHMTSDRPHGKHVYFDDVHVVFLGKLNDGEIREFVQSNSFQVEVHDRDQKDEEEDENEASLFGEEKLDEKLSNVGVVSSKQTTRNAFQSRKRAYDPFGVSKVSLMDLLRGHKKLHIQVPVTQCPIPNVFTDPPGGDEMRVIGVQGAVDRPERPPQPAGEYVQAGTTLKIKLELSYPFVQNVSIPQLLPAPNQTCHFSRTMFCFNYKNKDYLTRIEDFVRSTNAKALNLDHFERSVIDAALSTFKLSIDQKRSQTLDIITGFHIIDGNIHLMVLEGLKQGAMKRMLDEVKRVEGDEYSDAIKHLYDTSMSCSRRLYASLDVDLCRVRLHQSLPEIMMQPLLYVRDMVPRGCLDCLTRIYQMTQCDRLRDVFHSDLFPTPEMLISLSREFGVPLTYEDFEFQANSQRKVGIENASELQKAEESQPHPDRRWTPVDNNNPWFESFLKHREIEGMRKNFVNENIVAVQEAGRRHRPLRPAVRSLTADGVAHNYSIQTLNTSALAKDELRELLRNQEPDARFAYNLTYNSAMLSPVNVDAYHREREEAERKAWRTKDGFVYPGVKSSLSCNEHSLKPDQSRIDDLKFGFKDNILHRNIMKATLDRDRLRWSDRKFDLELYKQPLQNLLKDFPGSVHPPYSIRKQEEALKKRAEVEGWWKRIVVDDPRMRFHRVLCATEQRNKSNQLDRLHSLLKDPPQKLALKHRPLDDFSPLSVILNPSVDTKARARGAKLPPAFDESCEENHGFAPGPLEDHSWNLEMNKIPIKDEEHARFASIHGHDMNLYHKERTLLSMHVPIKPLDAEERRTHLFRIPPIPVKESDEEPTSQEIIYETSYGEGLHDRSEYRVMFPHHDVTNRSREIYPRHTFDGFGSVTEGGKTTRSDASVHLVATDKDQSKEIQHSPLESDMKRGIVGNEPNMETAEAAKTLLQVA